MKESQLISWIFLATAFASEKAAANVNTISQLADGISQAIPNHEELL